MRLNVKEPVMGEWMVKGFSVMQSVMLETKGFGRVMADPKTPAKVRSPSEQPIRRY